MGRPHTLPDLYDSVLRLRLALLKRDGYFKPNIRRSGIVTWHDRYGEKRASISIETNTLSDDGHYIELDYRYGGDTRKYRVYITYQPSNLGKGLIPYFVCPQTGKRCRILYSIGGYFLHREAFNHAMYECQTQSKRYRDLERLYGAHLRLDSNYEKLHKKHFMKYYAGKPTKRYQKILREIQRGESVPYQEVERAMIM
ncbi:hypothetical protein [Parapedobacter soli]|uniref:hypothetical protein n=1 Tax=Parapedobacter soli TaxID=416955 RepID=UPI0021C883BB|nr:hypothetical protein [Parapedobacter soli]